MAVFCKMESTKKKWTFFLSHFSSVWACLGMHSWSARNQMENFASQTGNKGWLTLSSAKLFSFLESQLPHLQIFHKENPPDVIKSRKQKTVYVQFQNESISDCCVSPLKITILDYSLKYYSGCYYFKWECSLYSVDNIVLAFKTSGWIIKYLTKSKLVDLFRPQFLLI